MRVYVYAREKCLMSNLFPSHACVASIKGSATSNMLFMVSKNGGVEGVGKKSEYQGDFFSPQFLFASTKKLIFAVETI